MTSALRNPFEDRDPFAKPERQPIWFEARGTYAPAWYLPHERPETIWVTQDGEDLGFTVADVAPERRWAIAASGALLPAHEFAEKHERWYRGYYQLRDQAPDDPHVRPIPSVRSFVAKRVSPSDPSRLEHIVIKADRALPTKRAMTAAQLVRAIESASVDEPTATAAPPRATASAAPAPKGQTRPARRRKGRTDGPVEEAACGHRVKSGYRRAHALRCRADVCRAETGRLDTPLPEVTYEAAQYVPASEGPLDGSPEPEAA